MDASVFTWITESLPRPREIQQRMHRLIRENWRLSMPEKLLEIIRFRNKLKKWKKLYLNLFSLIQLVDIISRNYKLRWMKEKALSLWYTMAGVVKSISRIRCFWRAVKLTFTEYAGISSIQGFQYLVDPKGNLWTKYLHIFQSIENFVWKLLPSFSSLQLDSFGSWFAQ